MKKTKPAAKPPKPAAIIEYGVNHLELERRIDAVHTAAENLLSITQIDGEELEALKEKVELFTRRIDIHRDWAMQAEARSVGSSYWTRVFALIAICIALGNAVVCAVLR